jgi:hypothetical protein
MKLEKEAMTTPKLLYILFRNPKGGDADARAQALQRAHQIANWPGLLRKTWIYDAATQEYGGMYLFADETSLNAYLDGPVVANMKAVPGVEGFQARVFEVNVELSHMTRGLPHP